MRAAIPLVLLALLCLHWRNGLQLETGLTQIDDYVINPWPRSNFQERSAAIDLVQNQPGILRVVGYGSVLFPGVNGMFDLESIYGPDPLANPYHHELLTSAGVRQEWSWRWIVERTNLRPLALYKMLNVGYFLDMPPRARPEIRPQQPPLDLQVLRNEGDWPRAFFVSALGRYDRIEQFIEMLRLADSRPFAATQAGDPTVPSQEERAAAGPISVPADDYHLTNNTTTFTINAPGPGFAVLTGAYLAQDFYVTVNGGGAEYFRVNHAFRGVRIPATGKYVVSYSYWPGTSLSRWCSR